jgi:uncharacterized protein (TIGR02246 family)
MFITKGDGIMLPPSAADESAVTILYMQLLNHWNHREAGAMAGLFLEDGHVVGFDGSQIDGRAQIAAEMGRIFHDHQTAVYFGKVREIRFLGADTALLRGVVGMLPPGQSDIDPAVNAIQSLVALKQNEEWQIALFQNTPAQFHGRPEVAAALTEELRQLLTSL